MPARLVKICSWWLGHPKLSALVLGGFAATAYPPWALWPVGLAALALFIVLLRRVDKWLDAAIISYLFGWAHLTIANNWIATAFTYQAEMPAILGWFAVPLLCLYLAIYPAVAGLAAHRVASGAKIPAFSAVFAAAWIITEWLRSWIFTGYPWPPLGLMLLGGWERPGLAALLPWLGTYALSGVAILIAGVLIVFWQLKVRWIALPLAFLGIAAAMYWPAPATQEGHVPYALVQPLIPQEEIDDPTKFEEQFARIARLTLPGHEAARLVLWPESAVPDYLENGYPQRYYDRMTAAGDPDFARARIGSVIGENSLLLTGAVNLEIGQRDGRRRATGAYNSILLLDGTGDIRAEYAKAHLVPYGEYLPMRWLLEPLGASRLVAGSIDFIPGPGPQTISLGEFGNAGMQICYEIVFSGQVVDRSNRPDYIFNPSNDGWFGAWGPPQHLAQARMRAIEEGLPVLRSTTTGISAVIDANGVVRQAIGRGQSARLDGFIPPAKDATLFAQWGNALPLFWAGVLALLSLVALRHRDS